MFLKKAPCDLSPFLSTAAPKIRNFTKISKKTDFQASSGCHYEKKNVLSALIIGYGITLQ